MNIFIAIIACLSYTAIFFLIYTITWGLSRHIFVKIKIYYEILLGFGFGVVSLFGVIVLSILINDETWIYLTILLPFFLYWATLTFISVFAAVGVVVCNALSLFLFPNLFPQYYPGLDNLEITILVSTAYLVPLLLFGVDLFLKKLSKWSKWSLVTAVCLLVGFFVVVSKLNDPKYLAFLMTVLVWLAAGYVNYGCLAILEQIYVHALRLENVVKFDDDYFLNQSSAHDELLRKIDTEHIRWGMYVTYFIKGYDTLENKIDNTIREKITTEFAHESYHNLKAKFEDAVFFKPNYKTYAMFVPMKEFGAVTDSDKKTEFLTGVQDCLGEIKKQFVHNDFKITIKVKGIISIFGINSNNLETLFELNNTTNIKKLYHSDEMVVYVDPFEVVNEKIKNKKLLTLNEIVPLNNATSYFGSIYNSQTLDYDAFFVGNLIDGNEVFSDNFEASKKMVEEYGLTSLFKRFLAMNSVKDITRNKIQDRICFVEYDARYLANQDFDSKKFIAKLKKSKINTNNLVLCFDANLEIDNSKLLKANIKELKHYGIKTALLRFGAENTEYGLVPVYDPNFIFIDGQICHKINIIKQNKAIVKSIMNIATKIEAQVIAPEVNSYMIYKTLKNLEIKLFFGELIGLGIKPKLLIDNELKYLLNK